MLSQKIKRIGRSVNLGLMLTKIQNHSLTDEIGFGQYTFAENRDNR
jgi:hypothetical protein